MIVLGTVLRLVLCESSRPGPGPGSPTGSQKPAGVQCRCNFSCGSTESRICFQARRSRLSTIYFWLSRFIIIGFVWLTSAICDQVHVVQGLTRIKPCQQRLVSEGIQLRIPCPDFFNMDGNEFESRRLEDCGVKDGSTIHLMLRVCGGMPATAGRVKMPVSF